MKTIENVELGYSWNSYIAALYGALKKAGLWQGEVYQLLGTTGMVFHFIIHESLCPSSVTVYEWTNEHADMLDRLGVYNRSIQAFTPERKHTTELLHADAVDEVKRSIDAGIPAIAWSVTNVAEFGLITGYDDEDEVFAVIDCTGKASDPLLYVNLGKGDVPILYVETLLNKSVPVDPEVAARESLQFGVGQWHKQYEYDKKYASGKLAYEYLRHAIETGNYDPFGLGYIMAVYSDTRVTLAPYLEHVARNTSLAAVADLIPYVTDCAVCLKELSNLAPFSLDQPHPIPEGQLAHSLELIRKAQKLDEQFYTELERVLAG